MTKTIRITILTALVALLTIVALSQNVTVTQPLTSAQFSALKYLLYREAQSAESVWYGQTNITAAMVKDYATNYLSISLADVVTRASEVRRVVIADTLKRCSDDALTTIESVLLWPAETDLSRAKVTLIQEAIALMPNATSNKLFKCVTELQ